MLTTSQFKIPFINSKPLAMYRITIALLLLASACTDPSLDGVYVLNKEKSKRNFISSKHYVADRESKRILREFDQSEMTLIISVDSVQFIDNRIAGANGVWRKFTPTKSGIKFTINERAEIVLEKNDSTYLLSIQEYDGMVSVSSRNIELLKLDQDDADKYLNSKDHEGSEKSQVKETDLARWTGTYMYPSGQLLIIDVTGGYISGKTGDGKDGGVTLSKDGKVMMDGEEAFLKNDTIFYTIHRAGGSTEVILTRVLNDLH